MADVSASPNSHLHPIFREILNAHLSPPVPTRVPTAALSKTMQAAFDYAKAHGGELVRFPGGFWYAPDAIGLKHFGTPTVEALVGRDVATYTQWQEGRSGRFPIRMTLRESGKGQA